MLAAPGDRGAARVASTINDIFKNRVEQWHAQSAPFALTGADCVTQNQQLIRRNHPVFNTKIREPVGRPRDRRVAVLRRRRLQETGPYQPLIVAGQAWRAMREMEQPHKRCRSWR